VAGSDIDCGSTCALPLLARSTVYLSATADQGSSFAGFTGCNYGSAETCGVILDADREVTASFVTGVVSTLAGTAGQPGSADGTGASARFNGPIGVAVDAGGNVFVADTDSATIRKIAPAAVVRTYAGTAGQPGSVDGTGTDARFSMPIGLAVDAGENVYVADFGSNTIRKITVDQAVTTLAGTASLSGSADGTGASARFNWPWGVAVDRSGNVYVTDRGNETIRRITSTGVVSTFAGSVGQPGSADGTGPAARFNKPNGLAVDGSGNVYVADWGNSTIRKITPAGVVSTLAGTAGQPGSVDGTGTAALFSRPAGLTLDGSGIIYVTDSNTVRRITPAGAVSTLAGAAGQSGSVDGIGTAARFNAATAVAVDGRGNVYVVDSDNSTIRRMAVE
jgi:sugar lactone lactonase YvrE